MGEALRRRTSAEAQEKNDGDAGESWLQISEGVSVCWVGKLLCVGHRAKGKERQSVITKRYL